MLALPCRGKVAARGLEPDRGKRRFAPAARRPERGFCLLHAFLPRAHGERDGGVHALWRGIFRRGGARKYFWRAISSGKIGPGRPEDPGEFLCSLKRWPKGSSPAWTWMAGA